MFDRKSTVALFVVVFGVAAVLQYAFREQDPRRWFDYNAAGAIGAAVGGAELLSRYKDSPRRLFAMPSAWFYILGNAGAAAFGLLLLRSFGWTFGATTGDQVRVLQVIVAGASAMLLLRSSLAEVQLDGKPVSAGPALIITSLLDSIERIIDRNQARYRSADVHQVMQGISFELAAKGLTRHVVLLLENPTPEAGKKLGDEASGIAADEDTSDQTRHTTWAWCCSGTQVPRCCAAPS